MAAWIAADFREFRGEEATARGWIQRAAGLLEGLPEVPEHGWVALIQADLAINLDCDSAGALPLCEAAMRIGRELGVCDLEAVGLALRRLLPISPRAASRRACAGSTRRW